MCVLKQNASMSLLRPVAFFRRMLDHLSSREGAEDFCLKESTQQRNRRKQVGNFIHCFSPINPPHCGLPFLVQYKLLLCASINSAHRPVSTLFCLHDLRHLMYSLYVCHLGCHWVTHMHPHTALHSNGFMSSAFF